MITFINPLLDRLLLDTLTLFQARLMAHYLQPYQIPPLFKYDGVKNGTLVGNIDPKFDDCSRTSKMYNVTVAMEGKNIGNLLNSKSITWGWFSAGFKLPSNRTGNITKDCNGRQSQTIPAILETAIIILTLNHFNIIILRPTLTIFLQLRYQ